VVVKQTGIETNTEKANITANSLINQPEVENNANNVLDGFEENKD
jgi:hypothetical protein